MGDLHAVAALKRMTVGEELMLEREKGTREGRREQALQEQAAQEQAQAQELRTSWGARRAVGWL